MADLCECGCGKAVPERKRVKGRFRGPKRRYFNGSCRFRAWKAGKLLVDRSDLEAVLSEAEERHK